METSHETRLPEADSLPDGFVESSSEPASSQPSDHSPQALDPDLVALSLQQLSTSDDSVKESNNVDTQGTNEQFNVDSNESKDAVEAAECLTTLKGSGEPKRKVLKRSVKSEKELLELTLLYQKAIAERDSAIAIRERLESLCRELQRQNKMLMEECRRVSTEGQSMRQDLSEKFNNAIKDVSVKLEEQKDECISQLRENEMLRNKLKGLADQYTIAEQQFAHKLKEKMLELELADLKIQQHQERSAQEKIQVKLYAEQISQLQTTERNLRVQLATDGEKFEQFEEMLKKSNEVFETYKQEMDKMVKRVKDLKTDNDFLKSKCEKSDIAIVKLVDERESMKKQLEKAKKQKEKLEALCRSLQAERKQGSVSAQADSSKDS
ncbi:hypothetical protein LUZ60_013047 [Juncus effusus]|nr:hypothetical protein LUZ60_013047 [Juncus effusus]